MEAGKLDIEPRMFDPLAVLNTIVESRAGVVRAAGKPVDVILETRGEPVRSWCTDETRFRQISQNIIGNAAKFTASGYVKITLGTVPGPTMRTLLRVMVEDTGPGIASDAIPKLFVPFSQAKPSVVRKFGGTGLGLCICKMLIDRMGGTINGECGGGDVRGGWVRARPQHQRQASATAKCTLISVADRCVRTSQSLTLPSRANARPTLTRLHLQCAPTWARAPPSGSTCPC
jgi:K+-sensing histidine kinase KdpD